jgi:hypothetical protein
MSEKYKSCKKAVYQHGEVMFIEPMPAIEAERIVRSLRERWPGWWVDWHYAAGRAVFKKLRKPWWLRIFCGRNMNDD